MSVLLELPSKWLRYALQGNVTALERYWDKSPQHQQLLLQGRDVADDSDGWTLFMAACWAGHINVAVQLLWWNESTLWCDSSDSMAEFSSSRVVVDSDSCHSIGRGLLNINARDTALGWTALHGAVWNQDLAMVQFLLHQADLDVNAVTTQGQHTALHLACCSSLGNHTTPRNSNKKNSKPLNDSNYIDNNTDSTTRLAIVQALLDHWETNVNVCNAQGRTPLHEAVAGNHPNLVEYLLTLPDIDVNVSDRDGNTPLHIAVAHRQVRLLQVLLQHPRIHIDACNHQGVSALPQPALRRPLRTAPLPPSLQQRATATVPACRSPARTDPCRDAVMPLETPVPPTQPDKTDDNEDDEDDQNDGNDEDEVSDASSHDRCPSYAPAHLKSPSPVASSKQHPHHPLYASSPMSSSLEKPLYHHKYYHTLPEESSQDPTTTTVECSSHLETSASASLLLMETTTTTTAATPTLPPPPRPQDRLSTWVAPSRQDSSRTLISKLSEDDHDYEQSYYEWKLQQQLQQQQLQEQHPQSLLPHEDASSPDVSLPSLHHRLPELDCCSSSKPSASSARLSNSLSSYSFSSGDKDWNWLPFFQLHFHTSSDFFQEEDYEVEYHEWNQFFEHSEDLEDSSHSETREWKRAAWSNSFSESSSSGSTFDFLVPTTPTKTTATAISTTTTTTSTTVTTAASSPPLLAAAGSPGDGHQ